MYFLCSYGKFEPSRRAFEPFTCPTAVSYLVYLPSRIAAKGLMACTIEKFVSSLHRRVSEPSEDPTAIALSVQREQGVSGRPSFYEEKAIQMQWLESHSHVEVMPLEAYVEATLEHVLVAEEGRRTAHSPLRWRKVMSMTIPSIFKRNPVEAPRRALCHCGIYRAWSLMRWDRWGWTV